MTIWPPNGGQQSNWPGPVKALGFCVCVKFYTEDQRIPISQFQIKQMKQKRSTKFLWASEMA